MSPHLTCFRDSIKWILVFQHYLLASKQLLLKSRLVKEKAIQGNKSCLMIYSINSLDSILQGYWSLKQTGMEYKEGLLKILSMIWKSLDCYVNFQRL